MTHGFLAMSARAPPAPAPPTAAIPSIVWSRQSRVPNPHNRARCGRRRALPHLVLATSRRGSTPSLLPLDFRRSPRIAAGRGVGGHHQRQVEARPRADGPQCGFTWVAGAILELDVAVAAARRPRQPLRAASSATRVGSSRQPRSYRLPWRCVQVELATRLAPSSPRRRLPLSSTRRSSASTSARSSSKLASGREMSGANERSGLPQRHVLSPTVPNKIVGRCRAQAQQPELRKGDVRARTSTLPGAATEERAPELAERRVVRKCALARIARTSAPTACAGSCAQTARAPSEPTRGRAAGAHHPPRQLHRLVLLVLSAAISSCAARSPRPPATPPSLSTMPPRTLAAVDESASASGYSRRSVARRSPPAMFVSHSAKRPTAVSRFAPRSRAARATAPPRARSARRRPGPRGPPAVRASGPRRERAA